MATAYAAVVSLMNTLENIKNHPQHSLKFKETKKTSSLFRLFARIRKRNPRCSFGLDKEQIESLGEKISFLEEFLENYSYIGGSSDIEALGKQIASAAHAAEDLIEIHIVDQIHAGSNSFVDLKKVIEDMDSVMEKVRNFHEEREIQDVQVQTTFLTPVITTEKSKMVGCDDEFIQLMDLLTGQQSRREIISIVGMGGIGKTTLAKNAYENLLIVETFDIRLWVTVSQEYSLREIFIKLLPSQTNSSNGLDKEIYELGEQFYKNLFGRRYLIVLDDMWSIEAWDGIKKFVPDNNNGSRIVVTTRESNLAMHLSSTYLSKKFLDEDASWKLFCEKAFAEKGCPSPKLEVIGKRIVEKCKGLPLLVSVIGGLLRKATMTPEYWENIAEDLNSVLINSAEDERCSNILFLSYRRLPPHLRPCLLYMGIFPEDRVIHVSELIKLWVAEGFLKPNEARSLEEVAEIHIEELVSRNLILARDLGKTGKIKTCSIHDVIRDLCLRVAEEEEFLYVLRSRNIPREIDMTRRIVFPERIGHFVSGDLSDETPHIRSLLCHVHTTLSSGFKLLRVWNKFDIQDDFQYVNLRYLACSRYPYVGFYLGRPSSIVTLWNIQTLILNWRDIYDSPVPGPVEIWNMTQLRHLVFTRVYLSDTPSQRADQQGGMCFILRNLQTLKTVRNFKLSAEVCKRIPNLKKLKLEYHGDFPSSNYDLANLGSFRKLESLFLHCDSKLNLKFPNSLKKLYLGHCRLDWEEVTMIGSLPHLEALTLGPDSVRGPEWSPVEGEFLRLKYLKINCSGNDLIRWNADKSHFPILENLVISQANDEFEGIPLGIGEIPMLRGISVEYCSEYTAISAVRILEEQERSLGNEGLLVRIQLMLKEEEKILRELIEEELDSFTSINLQLRLRW